METIGDPASEDAVQTRPLGFYFLKPEIIPHNAYGTHRFDASGQRIEEFEVSHLSKCTGSGLIVGGVTGLGFQCKSSAGGTVPFIQIKSRSYGSISYKDRVASVSPLHDFILGQADCIWLLLDASMQSAVVQPI